MATIVERHYETITSSPNGISDAKSTLQDSLLSRAKKRWQAMMVISKDANGKYTISQPLALVLLTIAATIFFGFYYRSSDMIQTQHDEIIRLQTKLEMTEKANVERDSKIAEATNWATSARGDVKHLEGRFEQFALDYAVKEKK